MGGLLGSVSAGYLSDAVFSGRRGPVISVFTLCVAPAVVLFMPGASTEWRSVLQYPAFGLIGFASFAPHVLIGLAARELAQESMQSTAGGFVTMVSRLGGVCAGAPLGMLIQLYVVLLC